MLFAYGHGWANWYRAVYGYDSLNCNCTGSGLLQAWLPYMNDILVNAATSGRNAYAVVPDLDDPIILQIDGRLCRIISISASGFQLETGSVDAGRRYPFKLDLPTGGRSISGYVDVLPQDDDEFLSCQFVNLTSDESDSLHQYVLVRQKTAIRAIRAARNGCRR